MKIILSRKGFDSSNGGVASPILPSGELCWLPIPTTDPGIRYREIRFRDTDLGEYVADLTRGSVSPADFAHLDPDLDANYLDRMAGWKPLFGQTSAAQTHLLNNGVGRGDVFLFYAWFRAVRCGPQGMAYDRSAPDVHAIFGWLQVDKVWSVVDRGVLPDWALYHPHLRRQSTHKNDVVYVAADTFDSDGMTPDLPGAGVMRSFRKELCLTAPGCLRSIWRMPAWFSPAGRRTSLSYHSNPDRWAVGEDCVYLQSVCRGQEFVLDCDDYPESADWLSLLLTADR